ncbi:hypothetical protein [Bacillus sp. 1NLA3E]|uniref:hypothetical protein n=1 Tax=Bacillus sp. 1NLA3E TaxID=666686 RepID=UPI000247EBCA|nr:hypothetical protein [Bacillus sp. 1NLA3E]AGK55059.1 hypothetical protein B1NLA3E_16575 [Bacillus sp. 1NLA3E]
MKRLLAFLTIFTLMFAVAGCSSTKDDTSKTTTEKKATEKTSELTDQVKSKMYNAVRIAEGKVNEVFAKEMAADETTPVLTSTFADEAAAEAFLSKYYSADIAKEIYTYYVTDQKTTDGQTIVKADPFFAKPILDTTKDDVTVEGDANKATVKTKDNVTYTVELKDNTYVVTAIQK